MSVWEKKRQEREQQKNMVFGTGPQMSNPVVFQGGGQQMSAAALGISAVSKPISDQSAAVLSQAGIAPPPANQNRPASGWHAQPSQTSFNNVQQQPQHNITPQPQQYQRQEPQLPVNQRDEEKQRYEQSRQQLTFDSYQPKRQQITQGDPEFFDQHQQSLSKKKPSEMTDAEYAEFEKRQIKSQQMRLLKSVVWNPKASSFDKREVEELCKVDQEFKKQFEAEMAVKKQQDEQAAQQLKQKEEERLRAERAEQQEREARETEATRVSQKEKQAPQGRPESTGRNMSQPEPQSYPQQIQDSLYQGSQFGQNSQYGEQPTNYSQGPAFNSQGPYVVPNMPFPPQNIYGSQMGPGFPQAPYGQPYGQMYGQQGFPGQNQGRSYYQSANAPSEPGMAQLQDELKMLRERLRRAELDVQTYEKTISELKYQLQQEKDARIEAEKALLAAQRDLQRQDGNFQSSLKTGQQQNQQQWQPQHPPQRQQSQWHAQSQQPQDATAWARQQSQQEAAQLVNNILNNNIESRQGYQSTGAQNGQVGPYSTYTKQGSRPNSGQPPRVLNAIHGSPTQVDKILNSANEIIDLYQVSAQTLARAQESEFSKAREQLYQQKQQQKFQENQWKSSDIIPNQSPSNMRTLQADSSLIDNMNTVQREQYEKEKSNRELTSLLNEDPNYNTITMQRPPDDVPPSLLESLDVRGGIRPQPADSDGMTTQQAYYSAVDIARKFGQAK